MHGGGNRPYGIPIFDDLHTYLPALLYDNRRFTTVQSLLTYIRGQARYHLDVFSREQRAYRGAAPRPAAAEPVVDTLLQGLFGQQHTTIPVTMEFAVPGGATIFDLLNAPGFMNPVPVRPTQEQIDAGSELVVADDYPGETANCSICQDALRASNGPLRRIRHCRHTFHRACIDTWFTSHVQCPECRHDIRDP